MFKLITSQYHFGINADRSSLGRCPVYIYRQHLHGLDGRTIQSRQLASILLHQLDLIVALGIDAAVVDIDHISGGHPHGGHGIAYKMGTAQVILQGIGIVIDGKAGIQSGGLAIGGIGGIIDDAIAVNVAGAVAISRLAPKTIGVKMVNAIHGALYHHHQIAAIQIQ